MARGRMVSRSIFGSARVAGLSCDGARLLYTWLIVNADNLGRQPGEPIQVKASVLLRTGATVRQIESWLGEMARSGLVQWYGHQGQRFIYIEGWEKHQKLIGNMAKHSELPDPKNGVCTPYIRRSHGVPLEVEVEVEGEVETEMVSGADRVGVCENGVSLKTLWNETFDETFWPDYPRKVAKDAARDTWNRIKLPDGVEACGQLLSEIMSGLRWYNSDEWADRPQDKITHASTWLNQRRWRDALNGPERT